MRISTSSSKRSPYIQFSTQTIHLKLTVFRLLQRLIEGVIGQGELKIFQKRDRHGNQYWNAYDPQTESHMRFTSEAEVRQWLDQRYYQ